MGKTIIRVEKERNYTTINNASVQDKRLSWKAKGIHVFMLTRPDDWVFYNEEMQTWSKDGRDSFLAGLKELQKYGYVEKVRERNENGTFDYITVVYEIPKVAQPNTEYPHTDKPLTGKPLTDYPLTENPLTDYPLTENPQLLNTNKQITNTPNTNKQKTKGEESPPPSPIDMNLVKVQKHFEQHVTFQPATFQQSKQLCDLLDDFNNNSELIIEAMKVAVQRGKPNIPYIKGILRAWRTDGISSVQQLVALGGQQHATTTTNHARPTFKQAFGHDVGF